MSEDKIYPEDLLKNGTLHQGLLEQIWPHMYEFEFEEETEDEELDTDS